MHEADLLKAGDFVVGQMRALAAATFALQEQPPPGFMAAAAPPEPDFVVKLDARVQLAGLRANLPAPAARGPAVAATARKAAPRAGNPARTARPQPKAAAPLPPRVAPFPQLPQLDLVPHAAVWDVLMLWDMGNTFAPLLQLPPFSLDRAAAAFWDCRPLAPAPLAGARAAAATLFSDFCCGLARVIKGERAASLAAGASLTAAHQEGITASALETALGRVAWPAHVADLFGRTDMDDDGDWAPAGSAFSAAATEALSAALEADADCWDALQPSQRLALATSLADVASGSDALREYFNAAYEAAQASQRLGRVPANPVRQSAGDGLDTRAAAEDDANATLDEATIQVARSWEDAAADRSLLRRGQPVGVDELGNRYYELGAAAGANALFVAHPAGVTAGSDSSVGCALLDFGSAPRWSTVASGSRAASELATWLLPRRCAGEHAPKAFCERLAASREASQAPGFAAPAPVHDGYTAFEAASALPGGLLGARRVVEALARRVHFWQLPANELAEFATDLRKLSEPESTAFSGEYSLDIVAAHAVSVCSRLTASRTLPAAVWDSSARHVWQDLLAEAVTAPQLGVALAYLHAALEAADSAAAHGAAAVVMDHQSFLLAAAQHDPTLWIPAVGDDVAVLRAGLLRTWRCLSKSWGVAPPAGLAPVTRARVLAASYRRAASGSSYGKRAAAWLLLDAGDGAAPFIAPVMLAEGATECVLRYKQVADALAKPWARGDAVTIPIVEDDSSTRHVPGVVVKLREGDADPWESVRIRCRPETAGELHRSAWVSPWELSSDAAAGGQLDAQGGLLLELPTSDEDEELDEPSSSSSSGAAGATAVGPAALHRKLQGRNRRASGGKAKLRRGPTSARPVPVPLGASAASVAAATRQLLAEIQSGDPEARPAPGDDAAARLAGMKEFWRRYRAYWQPRGGTPRVPIFARMELELWPAFQAVASRGGYDAVGASKQWIAVARSLPGRDLSTATSASFSMRVAYERSVFAFERSAVALLLGQPDPFPATPNVAAAVAEVCGHDERNRRKSGGAAAAARKPAAPAQRAKRTRSDDEQSSSDDDDDDAAVAAAAPVRRPPPRAAARGRAVAKPAEEEDEDWDLAGVAAGRRARKRVCYKDTDSEEQDGAPAAVRKPAAGRRRAPRSSDEDDEEEDEDEDETSDDADSDADSDEDGDEDGDEDAEPEAVEKSEEEKSSSGESDGAVLRYRSVSRHKARRRVVIDDDDDDA